MIFTNIDLTDEQNDYHFWNTHVAGYDQHRLIRQHVQISQESISSRAPPQSDNSLHLLHTNNTKEANSDNNNNKPGVMELNDLKNIFISRYELSIGQLLITGNKGVQTYEEANKHSSIFVCWACWGVCVNIPKLEWIFKACIQKNKKTGRLYYLWGPGRGEFCSPGCLFGYAKAHPNMFPEQTAGFNKLMLMRAFKYKNPIKPCIPYWKLPICDTSLHTRTPLLDSENRRATWRVKLQIPDPNKHKFYDDASTLVVLIDMKRFNMFMNARPHLLNNPLCWYSDFLKDFSNFTCMPQYIHEIQKQLKQKTFMTPLPVSLRSHNPQSVSSFQPIPSNLTHYAEIGTNSSHLLDEFLRKQQSQIQPLPESEIHDLFQSSNTVPSAAPASTNSLMDEDDDIPSKINKHVPKKKRRKEIAGAKSHTKSSTKSAPTQISFSLDDTMN
jgi:hypothetical protein